MINRTDHHLLKVIVRSVKELKWYEKVVWLCWLKILFEQTTVVAVDSDCCCYLQVALLKQTVCKRKQLHGEQILLESLCSIKMSKKNSSIIQFVQIRRSREHKHTEAAHQHSETKKLSSGLWNKGKKKGKGRKGRKD